MDHEEHDIDLLQGGRKIGDHSDGNVASHKQTQQSQDVGAAVHQVLAERSTTSILMRAALDGHDIEQESNARLDTQSQGEHDHETVPYPEPEDGSGLLPPPDFKPFFTIVEDSNGDHHHPFVHYIFADDDYEILTDAALDTLSTAQPHPHPDKDIPGQRFVIVDLAADGKDIVSASSLSPDWQALTTKISPAPSWSGGSEKGSVDRGNMLTIHGHEARAGSVAAKGQRKKGGSVEDMLKAFDLHLDSLDGVLGMEVTTSDTHVMQHD